MKNFKVLVRVLVMGFATFLGTASAVTIMYTACDRSPSKASADGNDTPVQVRQVSQAADKEDPLASIPRVSIPRVPDSRTPAQLRVQACTAFDGSWRCRGAKPQVMAAASTAPIIPVSWTIPAWYIDPANSSGTASDLNDCTTSATACVTCQEIEVHRWGTFNPRLRQNTVITGLSNWSGNGDPCYFYPYYENGATFSVQGNLGAAQTVATGTITVTAAKNTTTGQLLNATLPAGGAVGQLVKNTTNLSFAWIYKNVAGNTWAMSQPLTPVAIPVASNIPVEVTWTTGDTVTMYAPISVYIGGMGNTITNFNGALDNIPVIYHVSVLAPVSNDPLLFTAGMIYVAESQIAGRIVSQVPVPNPLSSAFINVDNNGIFHGAGASQTPTFVSGGQLRGAAADCVTCSLQRDVIVGTNTNILGTSSYREVYIDSGKLLTVTGASSFTPQTSPVIWGTGTLGVVANSRIQYPLNAAVATFKQSGALFIGAGTTAHSIFTVANVDTVCGGITVTPAALDLAASATCSTTGFGGLAFIPGGASIADFN